MSRIACFALGLSFAMIPGLPAQDEPAPPVSEQRAAVIVQAETNDDGEVVDTFAIASTDGGAFFTLEAAPGGAPFMLGSNPTEASEFLLNDPGVQKELELLDGQLEQLRQMQSEFGKEIKTKIDDVMKQGGPGKEKIGEMINEINDRRKGRLAEILLPHQIERLKQISFQSHVKHGGLGNAFANKALAEQLGIDEEQQEALAKKAEELRKEFEEKVAKLKEEMREELIDELTPEQRKKIKELMGDTFEFDDAPHRMMLGPRGGRGERVERSSNN
jgi:hypothetical protein